MSEITQWNGKELRIMDRITDEKYGCILDAYYDHEKVYIIGDKIVEDQSIIDELDDKYGIPVAQRNIVF